MVDLSDRRLISQSISALSDPRETAVVLATRSVLRALPLVINEYNIRKSKGALEFPFKMFAGASLVWTIARYPELRARLRPQVKYLSFLRGRSVGAAMSFALAAADRAAGNAPHAAGPAAADAASGAIEAARHAFLRDSIAADAAVKDDFYRLANGALPRELASEALWVGEMPDIMVNAIQDLYVSLSMRLNWDIWINWYEARLLGRPSDRETEIGRVSSVGKYPTWSIRAINAEIAGGAYSSTASWAEKLATLKQARLGAKFVERGGRLTIDPAGEESDAVVSQDPVMSQLHEGIKRRAREFCDVARRVDNLIGWRGLGAAAIQFREAVECGTKDVPGRIGYVYDSAISLGSFLDLDARLRRSSDQASADPLDLEVQRAFVDLIRATAPWLRRFPTARMLDDEAGAFLTRTQDFDAAVHIAQIAESTDVILKQDSELLTSIIEAARRGGFQGDKASARSVWSSKNLVTALALIFSFETGLVNNKAAEQSIIAQNGARLYLKAETEILRLFEDSPEDIKQALAALFDDLRRRNDDNVPILPGKPRERFDKVRRWEEADSEEN